MPNARGNKSYFSLGLLLVLAIFFGVISKGGAPEAQDARAQFGDKTPLGGKGLVLVLERLGYTVNRQTRALTAMPGDAKVWLLLDPQTHFTGAEGDLLLSWVEEGNTLLWAVRTEPAATSFFSRGEGSDAGQEKLRKTLDVEVSSQAYTFAPGALLPTLTPLTMGSASVYRTGVKKAQGSANWVSVGKKHLEIAGSTSEAQIARVDYGKGQIFVIPDAMLCTNYALAKTDNAILVTNMIRAHALTGAVYFDERVVSDPAEPGTATFKPTLPYYLWQPPMRWAWLQLALAGLLFWAMAGRRLGASVALPQRGPVTRASQYAAAMGQLFHKVDRPKAAARLVGDDFRRRLARRLGMSPNDPDAALARRAHEISGLPLEMLDRLLLHSKAPSESEAAALRDAQEMEMVLRHLNVN